MDCCALYVGSVYVAEAPLIAEYNSNDGIGFGENAEAGHVGRCLGNTQNLTIDVSYPQRNTFRRNIPYKDNILDPDFVSVNFTVNCDSVWNKQDGYVGDYNEIFINAVSVTDYVVEPVTSFTTGDFIAFEHPAVDISTLVVKRSDTLAVLTDVTDYIKSTAGFQLRTGFSSGIDLLISYNYNNQSYEELQTFVNLPIPRGLFFSGENVSTGDKLSLTFGHVEFQPISQLEYLGKEFVTLNLTANVIPLDYSGNTLSDYFIERRFL